jgi:hypothetical protein
VVHSVNAKAYISKVAISIFTRSSRSSLQLCTRLIRAVYIRFVSSGLSFVSISFASIVCLATRSFLAVFFLRGIHSNMSDDEYYYEYEEDDYQYADEVPELVVSVHPFKPGAADASNSTAKQ